jgi:hypothetical protein
MPKKVDSAAINSFIKANAHRARNWNDLADLIKRELGIAMTQVAVRNRGNRLRVRTQGGPRNQTVAYKPTDPTKITPADPNAARVLEIILRRKSLQSVENLADALVTSPAIIRRALDDLKSGGHNVVTADGLVELSKEIPKADPFRIDTRTLKGKVFRFGLTADNHLCSKYERMDVLNALYDIWHEQGITTVYQCGNMIDGDAPFNKNDVIVRGLEAQSQYFAEHWPKRKGMTTYYITGDDHEGWYVQREGVDVGRYLDGAVRHAGRKDLVYLGHMEHDIVFRGKRQQSIMRLIHAGGGSSYATSYAAQKIVESYQGGEKPQVLLIGHYHKAEYGYPREVHCVQAGCTCDQTPFMRKNKLQAHVGGWTIEITLNDDGVITRFRQEWMPFFDKGWYKGQWRYQDLYKPRAPANSDVPLERMAA